MVLTHNRTDALPLAGFIYELLRRSGTSYSTLQVALFYLILLKDQKAGLDFTKDQPKPLGTLACRPMQCGRRMFLAALILASKYLQDRNYSVRAWSKICGLRICEINENETAYLKCIDHNLHIKKDVFQNWSKIVLTLSKLSKLSAIVSEAGHLTASNCDAFSNQWWTSLLEKLDPDVIFDAELTETFLQDNLPKDKVTAWLARQPKSSPQEPDAYP